MEPGAEPDDGIRKRRGWLVALCFCLLALSIFWSVDRSLVYLILALAAFSLFKILQLRQAGQSKAKYQPPFEKIYESVKPSQTLLFWQDVKEIFKKDSSGPKTPQQAKIFVALIAGFIGFIFFLTILGAIFGGEAEDASENYQRALEYYNNQQYDSAAYYYKFAIDDDPENPELFFERGNAFLNSNNTDSALIMYDNALTLQPEHQLAQYNKGYVYFNRKNYRQAIDETKKIMEYNPGYTDAMLLIGDSFYNQSQLDSALGWYKGAYSSGYRSAVLCHLMAYIYDTKGETNRAISLYKEAIGQDSSIVDIYSRLGELVPGDEGNWYRKKASQAK